jgi:hypothetical protein
MGNQISGPEKVYRAVKSNNLYDLQVRARAGAACCRSPCPARGEGQSPPPRSQDLVQRIQAANFDEATRRSYFAWRDGEGRTPLLLAAQKNYHSMAKLVGRIDPPCLLPPAPAASRPPGCGSRPQLAMPERRPTSRPPARRSCWSKGPTCRR